MAKTPPSFRTESGLTPARSCPSSVGGKRSADGVEGEIGVDGGIPGQGRSLKSNGSVSEFQRCLLFAKNFLKYPRALGMFLPSSRFLVRRALGEVPWGDCHVLVEYGPGVGHFTSEILRRMRPDAILIGIELNADFVRFLREGNGDPRLEVVEGSAADVGGILRRLGYARVDCVVAGIPFSTMSPELRERIVRETHAVLAEGGRLLVYQLASAILPHLRSNFRHVRREFEPFNLLPTQLFRCAK